METLDPMEAREFVIKIIWEVLAGLNAPQQYGIILKNYKVHSALFKDSVDSTSTKRFQGNYQLPTKIQLSR